MDINQIFERAAAKVLTISVRKINKKYEIPTKRWKGHAPKLTSLGKDRYVLIPKPPIRPGIVSVNGGKVEFKLLPIIFWGNRLLSWILVLVVFVVLQICFVTMLRTLGPGETALVMLLSIENVLLLLLIRSFRRNGFMARFGSFKFWSSVIGLLIFFSFIFASSDFIQNLVVDELAADLEPLSKALGYRSIIDIGPIKLVNLWPLVTFPAAIFFLIWDTIRTIPYLKRDLYTISACEAMLFVAPKKLVLRDIQNSRIYASYRSRKPFRWVGAIGDGREIVTVTFDGKVEIRNTQTLAVQHSFERNELTEFGETQMATINGNLLYLAGLLDDKAMLVKRLISDEEEWSSRVGGMALSSKKLRTQTIATDGNDALAWINSTALYVLPASSEDSIFVPSKGSDFKDQFCFVTYLPIYKMFVAGGVLGTVVAVSMGKKPQIIRWRSETATMALDLVEKSHLSDDLSDDLLLLNIFEQKKFKPVIGVIEDYGHLSLVWAPNGRMLHSALIL